MKIKLYAKGVLRNAPDEDETDENEVNLFNDLEQAFKKPVLIEMDLETIESVTDLYAERSASKEVVIEEPPKEIIRHLLDNDKYKEVLKVSENGTTSFEIFRIEKKEETIFALKFEHGIESLAELVQSINKAGEDKKKNQVADIMLCCRNEGEAKILQKEFKKTQSENFVFLKRNKAWVSEDNGIIYFENPKGKDRFGVFPTRKGVFKIKDDGVFKVRD